MNSNSMEKEKLTIDGVERNAEFTEEYHSHIAPILGVLLIMLVLILGGLYLWGAALTEEKALETRVIENNEPETPRAEADAEILETVSTSDSLEAIEADIESTNLDSLDAEMNEIELELDAALEE